MKRTPFKPRIKPLSGILRNTNLPALRTKKCAVCRNPFVPSPKAAKVCGPECAEQHAAMLRLKAERKADKARKETLKKHSQWEAELQAIVNKYVRVRDAGKPCISCGTMRTVRWEAGHYIAVGANNTLRFEPDNIHLQCHRCNYNLGGNHVQYRIGLEAKIGLARLEWLEGWHSTEKLSVERIKEMMAEFRAMTRSLQATKFQEAA